MKYQPPLLFISAIIVVACLTGIGGICFRLGVYVLQHIVFQLAHYAVLWGAPWLLMSILSSILLILIAWYGVYQLAPEAQGSGVPEIRRAFMTQQFDRWWRVIPVKLVGGLCALSAYLLVGREGPMVQLGGNIGQMIASAYGLSIEKRKTLMAMGAAAGLAAAFNTPVAGALFIFEELKEWFKPTWPHILGVALACGVASLMLYPVYGDSSLIAGVQCAPPHIYWLGWFVVFGLFLALVGCAFNLLLLQWIKYVALFSLRRHVFYLVCLGVVVGGLVIVDVNFVGEGYLLIHHVLHTTFSLQMVGLLFIVRLLLGVFSYGAGTPGGLFSPLLALGTLGGLLFAKCLLGIGILEVPMEVFAYAGMGGLFAGVVRIPWTATVLVVEMTHNLNILTPLLVTCFVTSHAMQGLGQVSIYEGLSRDKGFR